MVTLGRKKNLHFNPEVDVPNLTGKVMVVTGGNSGLGYETVKQLYAHGAKVYLACRDEQRGKDAIVRMKQELEGVGAAEKTRRGEVVWLKLDLNDPRKARKAAEELTNMENRLDVLVNNAGTTSGTYVNGPDTLNIQRTMMVNHLSPFVFTLALLPLLRRTAAESNSDVRIVNLSSSAVNSPTFKPGRLHFRNKEDFNDRQKDDRIPVRSRYGCTKVANALFCVALQARFEKDNIPILVAAVDPGFVYTEGIRGNTVNSIPRWFRYMYKTFAAMTYIPPSKGVAAQLYASTSPQLRSVVKTRSSKLLWIAPTGEVGKCPNQAVCGDEALAEELWTGSFKVLEQIGAECGDLA